jgi:Replication-relaxation
MRPCVPQRGRAVTVRHISHAAAERLVDRLSERDRVILGDLARVRVLTGYQLTRLHFPELSDKSRDRARRRVLARLAGLDLATTLERRIGGVRAGSAGLVYTLGVAGQHVVPFLDADGDREPARRPRQPWTPGRVFLAHTLAVAELYVRLVEAARTGNFGLGAYRAEPGSWVPNGIGGWLKPDAYALLQGGGVEDYWWIEVDRATESLTTLRRKLLAYLDFVSGGQLGPDGVVPRVLITVPDNKPNRQSDVRELLERLPEPADKLFSLTTFERAVPYIVRVLRE